MWEFVKSASSKDNWLQGHAKEVCFIGRSNVGKSTLVNAITSSTRLARVSHTPGRTQLINFFRNGSMVLVDLPGYGYARLSLQKREEMSEMVDTYFATRLQLVRVFLLVDAKVGPTSDDDKMLARLIGRGRSVTVVITKADKASQSQLVKTTRILTERVADIVTVSVHEGHNIAHFRKVVASCF